MAQDSLTNYTLRKFDLGAASAQPPPGSVVVSTSRGGVDISDVFKIHVDLGNALQAFHANPYDHRPLQAMRHIGTRSIPLFNQLHKYPALMEQFGPMATHLSNILRVAQTAAKLRVKAAADMARRPLQIVPVPLAIGAGASFTAIQIRNPYLGATGGVAISDQYKAPWSVTAFKTSNNENGQLSPIRIANWTIGGHNYTQAALQGLTYAGMGAVPPALQGWGAPAFAETKRTHHSTAFEPWHLTAESSAGWGFIMTETGFLQLDVINASGSPYVDTYSVYIRATLCGSPFDRFTDPTALAHAFVPMVHQYHQAARIAGDWESNVQGVLGQAARSAQPWTAQLQTAQDQVLSFMESPPPGLGDVLPYDHQAWGQLQQGQFGG